MDKRFISAFLKGSALTSIGTMATIIFHFLSIMVMTRNMDKESFGIYVLVMAVVAAFKIISGLGLDLTLVKFVSGDDDSERSQVFSAILVQRAFAVLLAGGLVYALGTLILTPLDVRLTHYLGIIAVLGGLFSYRELCFFYLQGLRRFKAYAAVQTASAAARIGLLLGLLFTSGFTVERLLYIELLTYGGSLLLQLLLLRHFNALQLRFRPGLLKETLQFGFPLYLNNLLTFLHARVSVFLIAFYMTPASVALYDVAKKVPEALARLFHSFITVYFPNISALFSDNQPKQAQKLMNKSLILSGSAMAFVVLTCFLFRDMIITVLFSATYIEAALALAFLTLNFYFRSLSNILGYSLVSAGHSSIPAKVNTIAAIESIVLCILLIPPYGFMGAVYARLAMNVTTHLIYYAYHRHLGMLPTIFDYLKPIALAAIGILIDLTLPPELHLLRWLLLPGYIFACWLWMTDIRIAGQFAFSTLQNRFF